MYAYFIKFKFNHTIIDKDILSSHLRVLVTQAAMATYMEDAVSRTG